MQLFISLYLQAHRLTPPRCTACIYLSLEYSSRNQDCASCLLSICCVAAGRRKHREEAQQLWTPGFCRQDNNKVRGRGALHTHLHPVKAKSRAEGPPALLPCQARPARACTLAVYHSNTRGKRLLPGTDDSAVCMPITARTFHPLLWAEAAAQAIERSRQV